MTVDEDSKAGDLAVLTSEEKDALLEDRYRGLPFLRTLQESPDDHTLPLVLSLFSAGIASRHKYSFMSFLPDMIHTSNEDSAIVLSCRAVAFAYMTNVQEAVETRRQRAKAYVQALKATNANLQD